MVLSHTLALIVITIIVSGLAWMQSALMRRLIFWSPAIKQGQFDRFITYGFVHADAMHLIFNLITLYFFGRVVENFYRQYAFDMGFALFYLGALIVAVLPSYFRHKHDQNWMTLGASGAISALLFAYILFNPWGLIIVFIIPMPAILFAILYVAYSIWAQRRANSSINHSAHLWGAAYGILMTGVLEPRVLSQFAQLLMHPRF